MENLTPLDIEKIYRAQAQNRTTKQEYYCILACTYAGLVRIGRLRTPFFHDDN